jgi:uncharacterized protein (TIGR02646 family)
VILIEKGPAPESLQKANAVLTQANLKIHDEHGDSTRVKSAKASDKKFSAGTIYITAAYRADEVKASLVKSHSGKCAYCETRLLSVSHGDVEHFRPKSEYKDGIHKGLGYFWLAYDWSNLFLGCQICNETYKGTYFALMPAVEGLIAPSEHLEPGADVESGDEFSVLVDPGRENPRVYVEFDPVSAEMGAQNPSGNPVAASRTGKMILTLGLNRHDLVVARHRHIAFLKSLFLLASPFLAAKAEAMGHLVKVCELIGALKQTKDYGAALGHQAKLVDLCKSALSDSKAPNNSVEAFRWLCFSVMPVAEYSALAQDCLFAWMKQLHATKTEARSPTAPPDASGYTATAHVLDWPPIALTPVVAHWNALKNAIEKYVKDKTEQRNNMCEALRQIYYDDLNDLVRRYNTFQTDEFDAESAEDLYLEWYLDLTDINDNLELLGGNARAAERAELHKFLDVELTRLANARRFDVDRDFRALCEDVQKTWLPNVTPLANCWKAAVQIAQVSAKLAEMLQGALKAAAAADASGLQSQGGLTIDLLEWLASPHGDALLPLSKSFNQTVIGCRSVYKSWRTATFTLAQWEQATKFIQAVDEKHKLTQARKEIEPLLPVTAKLGEMKAALDKGLALRKRCDDLVRRYADAGLVSGNWRTNTLHSIRNLLIDVQEARKKNQAELPLDPSKLIPLKPTSSDPWLTTPGPTSKLTPQPVLAWGVTTARKRLADFQAARAKLKSPRKLTAKQQAQYDELVADAERIRVFAAKLDAEMAANFVGAPD